MEEGYQYSSAASSAAAEISAPEATESGASSANRNASSTKKAITSTYRAIYGGPDGTSPDTWRSGVASSKELNENDADEVAEMLGKQVRLDSSDITSEHHESLEDVLNGVKRNSMSPTSAPESSSSLQRALKDISVLTTGRISSHRNAMKSLVGILKEFENSPEILREIHTQGGTHVLYTNIGSSQENMKALTAEGLFCICKHDQDAFHEVLSSRDICSAAIGVSIREILISESQIHRQLFELLIQSQSQNVQQSCAEHKVVLKCVERLENVSEKQGRVDTNALQMLCAMLDTGLEYYSNSVFWNGGLDVLVSLLSISADAEDQSMRDATRDIANIICTICRHHDDVADSLCTSESVQYLSSMLADPIYPIPEQLAVAETLLAITRVSKKRDEVISSLQDYCLPRVCEIIRQSKEQETSEESSTEYELWIVAAGILSYLSRDSDVCCHVIILHANILQQSILLLTRAFKYSQSRLLLDSAAKFAVNI